MSRSSLYFASDPFSSAPFLLLEVTTFRYRALRQDADGTIYLKCHSGGSGSGSWCHHLAVRIVDATQIRYDDTNQPYQHPYRRLELVSHLPFDFFD